MKKEAIFHLNTEDFIYPVSRKKLLVKIRTAREDIKNCYLIYFSRTTPEDTKEYLMERKYTDELFDYYEGFLDTKEVARYQKYYFRIADNEGNTQYLGCNGISDRIPKDEFFEYLYTNPGDIVESPDWAKGTVYYQIFPERFANGDKDNDPDGTVEWGSVPTRENYMGGDLKGVKDNIPYLRNLGVETIYLNPIFHGDFNHKYATTDYYTIDSIFGSNDTFGDLVKELHKNGMRILLDGVFNHVGVHFKQFEDVLKNGVKSRYSDWFLLKKEEDISITHKDYECVGAYKYMPKLNTSCKAVREFILEVMDYWIREYKIDGWRLDVSDEVDIRLWQEASIILREKYPDIILLGETWGYGGRLVGDKKLDCVMNYMFRDAVRDYYGYHKISTTDFANRISHMLALYKDETAKVMYNLIDSHDTERFLCFCKGDKQSLKAAVAFQMLFVGSPAIYYGDEVGMTGNNDPDCRGCMLWGDKQDKELLEYYKKLIKIRKEHSSIRKGEFRFTLVDDERGIIGFKRFNENEEIDICITNGNMAKEPYSIKVLSRQGGYENERT